MTRGRATTVAALVAVCLLTVGCASGERRPVRITLVASCHGSFGAGLEGWLAGALLPFVERGAKPVSGRPSDGLTGAAVGGRRVELRHGCIGEGASISGPGAPAELVALRVLVERDDPDIVVLTGQGPWATAVRDYARSRPQKTFVLEVATREAMLQGRPPNLFATQIDSTQQSVGIGVYAHDRLGWNTAVAIDADTAVGWSASAGFAAGFCAAGGTLLKRIVPETPEQLLAAIPQSGVDGVYLGGVDDWVLLELGRRLPLLRGALGRRLVGQWYNLPAVDSYKKALGARLDGVADSLGSQSPAGPEFRRFAGLLGSTFPDHLNFFGLFLGDLTYVDLTAVARALEAADGDLARFRAELTSLDFETVNGRFRLDENGQRIGPSFLAVGRWDEKAGDFAAAGTILATGDLDQTLGAVLPRAVVPGRTPTPCRAPQPRPGWATLTPVRG